MRVTQHGKHEKEENKRALIAAVLAASAGFYALLLFVLFAFSFLAALAPQQTLKSVSSSILTTNRPAHARRHRGKFA